MITEIESPQLDSEAYAQALREFQPRPIRNEADNARATALLERIVALESPSPELNEIADLLVMLIEKFEERYTLPQGSPLETLLELMAANDLKQKDIVALGHSKGMVSDVLNGVRPISRRLAQALAKRFNVPHTLFL